MRRLFESRQMSRAAMIVSVVALCVGVAGGAYAAKLTLKNKSVTTKKIKNGAVTGPKLASGAVASKVSIIGKHPGETITVATSSSKAGTITCPAGYQAIAGQAALVGAADSEDDMGMISSRRDDANPALWLIRMGNNDGVSHDWQLYATCIKVD